MIYFDNGATSFPKPNAVYREITKTMKRCGGNPGRGSHVMARRAADAVYALRESAAEMFHTEPENVIFSSNATHALNIAIKGLAEAGCHILISDMEHNSVRRPVVSLCRDKGCSYDVFPTSDGDEKSVIDSLSRLVRENTRLVVLCHVPNISNRVLPIKQVADFCKCRSISLVVDASQSAGHHDVNFKTLGADAVCMSGHKGLYGPQGTGILLVNAEKTFNPLMEGGSGSDSLDPSMPLFYPDRLEVGTLSAPLAAGLKEGIKWVNSIGFSTIQAHERELSSLLLDYLYEMNGVKVYGEEKSLLGATVLFNFSKFPSVKTSELLDRAGICVRSGLHCAPLAHETLATGNGGAVRVSFGLFNTVDHVRRLVDELFHINKYEN